MYVERQKLYFILNEKRNAQFQKCYIFCDFDGILQ